MPTFNQLVRKGRQTAVKKSTAPALQKGYNVVSQNKVPVSCTKTANYYISSIMMSLCTCL